MSHVCELCHVPAAVPTISFHHYNIIGKQFYNLDEETRSRELSQLSQVMSNKEQTPILFHSKSQDSLITIYHNGPSKQQSYICSHPIIALIVSSFFHSCFFHSLRISRNVFLIISTCLPETPSQYLPHFNLKYYLIVYAP